MLLAAGVTDILGVLEIEILGVLEIEILGVTDIVGVSDILGVLEMLIEGVFEIETAGVTDTLGGIHTELGYTVLEEQLGTFKKQEIPNPHAYDNTSNYYTGMNAKTVDGISTQGSGLSGKFLQNNKPIFLQKDFEGVANIFAPNIIIQNPPLTSDGYPDISFQM